MAASRDGGAPPRRSPNSGQIRSPLDALFSPISKFGPPSPGSSQSSICDGLGFHRAHAGHFVPPPPSVDSSRRQPGHAADAQLQRRPPGPQSGIVACMSGLPSVISRQAPLCTPAPPRPLEPHHRPTSSGEMNSPLPPLARRGCPRLGGFARRTAEWSSPSLR